MPRRQPTVAETRRQREHEERRLAGREWYGVQLDAPVRADAAATFADWILRDAATQEHHVTREQIADVMARVLSAKQKAILPLLLDGHSGLSISRQTGIPWTTVKRNVRIIITRVRVALGLETKPTPVRVNRLDPNERRRRRSLRTMRAQKRNQVAGLCRCGGKRVDGYLECQACRDRRTAQRRARRAQGKCRECRAPADQGRTYCRECLAIRSVRDRDRRGTPPGQQFAYMRGGGQGFSLRFPAEEWAALERYCEAKRITKANVIRAAVRRHVAAEGRDD